LANLKIILLTKFMYLAKLMKFIIFMDITGIKHYLKTSGKITPTKDYLTSTEPGLRDLKGIQFILGQVMMDLDFLIIALFVILDK